jgi:hypothetical protein
MHIACLYGMALHVGRSFVCLRVVLWGTAATGGQRPLRVAHAGSLHVFTFLYPHASTPCCPCVLGCLFVCLYRSPTRAGDATSALCVVVHGWDGQATGPPLSAPPPALARCCFLNHVPPSVLSVAATLLLPCCYLAATLLLQHVLPHHGGHGAVWPGVLQPAGLCQWHRLVCAGQGRACALLGLVPQ